MQGAGAEEHDVGIAVPIDITGPQLAHATVHFAQVNRRRKTTAAIAGVEHDVARHEVSRGAELHQRQHRVLVAIARVVDEERAQRLVVDWHLQADARRAIQQQGAIAEQIDAAIFIDVTSREAFAERGDRLAAEAEAPADREGRIVVDR